MNKSYDAFKFCVLDDNEDNDITYKLTLGANEFISHITCWSNDFASICEQLERLLFVSNTEISLDFDTEPTTISIQSDEENLSVHIEPSGFHHLSSIEGVCEKKEVIRTLYEGLLFAMTRCYDDCGCGWNWFDCKMVCYNLMKSRTIEEYLRTSSIQKTDNYVTKHILVFDGNQLLHICDETIGYWIPLSNSIIIKDKEGAVIEEIDGELLKAGNYELVANNLPNDFDFWTIDKDEEGYIRPSLIVRENKGINQIFVKESAKYDKLGLDPYGFTSETLYHACKDLDFDRIMHFLSLGADMTYFVRWILSSHKGGARDKYGEPTFDDCEEYFRKTDNEKARILDYAIDHYPQVKLSEDMLKECLWNYCPQCMKLLLAHGANPTERNIEKYNIGFSVKYRSVLNLTNLHIKDKKDKYGILQEMKTMLESIGAEDVIIKNEEYKE